MERLELEERAHVAWAAMMMENPFLGEVLFLHMWDTDPLLRRMKALASAQPRQDDNIAQPPSPSPPVPGTP